MFKSEIRESTIRDLFDKVKNRGYGKYLLKIVIDKARSISNKTIDFEFPVTAIVGPNGAGKTTIAGAAAILYKDIAPSLFFAKSGKYDVSMLNWKIEYEAIDKSIKSESVKRTAKYHNAKWARKTLDREVLVFGVSRTVPAAERKELRKCVSNNFEVSEDKIVSFSNDVANSVTKILGKDVSEYKNIQVDDKGNVTLLSGVNDNGETFSEFHFGAGESSIIRMVTLLEKASDNALVIIEEIENGLHPVATIRMVEYLIDLAKRKKIQAIFTTHSNDALIPLPTNAIWASVNGELYKGKLDIRSLRAISGQINSKLVIFVEDDFAKMWVDWILRSSSDTIAIDAISIHPMQGDGIAVKVHKTRKLDPSIQQKSVCFVDGDSEQEESTSDNIFKLPGECPEATVYDNVLEEIENVSGKLAVALLKKYEYEGQLKEKMQKVRNTTRDSHLLYAKLGEELGFIPEDRVKEAFLSIWCDINQNYVEDLTHRLKELIPLEKNEIDIKKG